MSNCHGCSKPIQFKYRTERGTYEPQLNGENEYVPGPVIVLPNGDPLLEDLCDTCIEQSKLNRPADCYDGCWNDKHCHPSHIVERDPEDYLI